MSGDFPTLAVLGAIWFCLILIRSDIRDVLMELRRKR